MICMRISIKGARKVFAIVVGTVESTLGVLAIIFAYFLSINFFGFQERLTIREESVPLFMLIFIVFGFFSIVSGLFLFAERGEAP